MGAESGLSLPKSWSALDFGLHAFLVVNPLALGLWTFSLAPLVGGNLFIAALLAGVVMVLGVAVFGTLAAKWPWTGGDYAWQTRLLDRRVGAVLALTSWWLVVVALAPVYGNVILVQVLDPVLIHAGWDGLAAWFRGRDGVFAASLIAIAFATAFVGLGMRRAAVVQRMLVFVGGLTLVAVLALLLTTTPSEFIPTFDKRATEIYGAGSITYGQSLYLGTFDARVAEVEQVDTLKLVPLVLLFALWIGWATPLVGEIRARRRDSVGRALVRAAAASTVLSLVLFVAIARAFNWEFWNEVNNLYWGTVYQTTTTTLLPTWPNPVVFAAWLSDSTYVQIALVAGMAAWVLGWTATLFLAATRVLLAAAADGVLPRSIARTTGDSVPTAALALLVFPACAVAALDAYWDTFAGWTSSAVVALALTTAGSAVAATIAFRRDNRAMAGVSVVFVLVVALVIGVWVLDPVYGIRTFGSLAFLLGMYGLSAVVYALSRPRRRRAAPIAERSS
ncbi:MAG: amino acid permease [Actinomycetota bacterium]|nr:amino acid permease [Actinomycetota bacterium]